MSFAKGAITCQLFWVLQFLLRPIDDEFVTSTALLANHGFLQHGGKVLIESSWPRRRIDKSTTKAPKMSNIQITSSG
jgi:hypothetical protein